MDSSCDGWLILMAILRIMTWWSFLGGMPGSTNLRDNSSLDCLSSRSFKAGKYVAAICAAPIVLERAGLLSRTTCFPGVEEQISGEHQTDLVVVDGNIVTSRGAGTALAFAYALVDLLGGDGQQLACSWFTTDCLNNLI